MNYVFGVVHPFCKNLNMGREKKNGYLWKECKDFYEAEFLKLSKKRLQFM